MIDLPTPPKKAPKKPELEEVAMNREMTKDELKVVSQINALLKAGVTFPPSSKMNYTPRRENGALISGLSEVILRMKSQERSFSSDLWLTKEDIQALGGSIKDNEAPTITPAIVRSKVTDVNREEGFRITKETVTVPFYNLEQCYNLPSSLWKPFLAKPRSDRSNDLRDRVEALQRKRGERVGGTLQSQLTQTMQSVDNKPLSVALAVSDILQDHGMQFETAAALKKSFSYDVWSNIQKEAQSLKSSFYFESNKLSRDLHSHLEIKRPLLSASVLEADYEPQNERIVLHKLSNENDKDLARIKSRFEALGVDTRIEVAPDIQLLMGNEIKTQLEKKYVTFMVANEHVFNGYKADAYVGDQMVTKADRVIPVFGGQNLELSIRKDKDKTQIGVFVVSSGAPADVLASLPNLVGRYNAYREMMKNQEFYKASLALNGQEVVAETGFSLASAKLILRAEALHAEIREEERFMEHNPLMVHEGKGLVSYRFGDNDPIELHLDQAGHHAWTYLYGERVDEQTFKLLDRALKDYPYITITVDSEVVAERLMQKGFFLEGNPNLDRSDIRGTLRFTETLVLRNEPPLMKQWEALDDALDIEDPDLNQLALSLLQVS